MDRARWLYLGAGAAYVIAIAASSDLRLSVHALSVVVWIALVFGYLGGKRAARFLLLTWDMVGGALLVMGSASDHWSVRAAIGCMAVQVIALLVSKDREARGGGHRGMAPTGASRW
jgi:hypothetical protein